jgi:hypothetical protein
MMALHRSKNFADLGRAGFSATGLVETKVFAPLFSKSGCFLYLIWSAL